MSAAQLVEKGKTETDSRERDTSWRRLSSSGARKPARRASFGGWASAAAKHKCNEQTRLTRSSDSTRTDDEKKKSKKGTRREWLARPGWRDFLRKGCSKRADSTETWLFFSFLFFWLRASARATLTDVLVCSSAAGVCWHNYLIIETSCLVMCK